MKKLMMIIIMLCCISATASAQGEVSNVRVQQHDALLYITYDLAVRADIEVFVSFDGGATYTGPLQHVSGAVGKDLNPEKDRILVWKVFNELGYVEYPNAVIKIVAHPVGENIAAPKAEKAESAPIKLLAADNPKNVYIFEDMRRLSKYEARQLIAESENAEALRWYDKSMRRHKIGNAFLWYPYVGLIFKATSRSAVWNSVDSYNKGQVAPVRGWYTPFAVGFDITFGGCAQYYGGLYGNGGITFTKNFSPYFGIDIARLTFAEIDYGSYYENSYNNRDYFTRSFQFLTGIRFGLPHFGSKKYTNFYSALRAGIGRNSGGYYDDNNKFFHDENYSNTENSFVLEADFGIHFRRLYLTYTLNYLDIPNKPFFHGGKIGWEWGRKRPY